jgi:hypothetical protein
VEGYKAVGDPDGTKLFGVRLLPRADDLSMPHALDVVRRLARPASGVGLVSQADWDRTVDDYIQKAIDLVKGKGVDVSGSGFTPKTVTLNPGGA